MLYKKGGQSMFQVYEATPQPDIAPSGLLSGYLSMLMPQKSSGSSSSSKSDGDDGKGVVVPGRNNVSKEYVMARNQLEAYKSSLLNKAISDYKASGSNKTTFINSEAGKEFIRNSQAVQQQEMMLDMDRANMNYDLQRFYKKQEQIDTYGVGKRVVLGNKNLVVSGEDVGMADANLPFGWAVVNTKDGQKVVPNTIKTYDETMYEYWNAPGARDKDGMFKAEMYPEVVNDVGAFQKYINEEGAKAQASMKEGAGGNRFASGSGAPYLVREDGSPASGIEDASNASLYSFLVSSTVGGNSSAIANMNKQLYSRLPNDARSDIDKQFYESIRNQELHIFIGANPDLFTEDDMNTLISMTRGETINLSNLDNLKYRYINARIRTNTPLFQKSSYSQAYHGIGTPGDFGGTGLDGKRPTEETAEMNWRDPLTIQKQGDAIKFNILSRKTNGGYDIKTVNTWVNKLGPEVIAERNKALYAYDQKAQKYISTESAKVKNFFNDYIMLPNGEFFDPKALDANVTSHYGYTLMPRMNTNQNGNTQNVMDPANTFTYNTKNGAFDVSNPETYTVYQVTFNTLPKYVLGTDGKPKKVTEDYWKNFGMIKGDDAKPILQVGYRSRASDAASIPSITGYGANKYNAGVKNTIDWNVYNGSNLKYEIRNF